VVSHEAASRTMRLLHLLLLYQLKQQPTYSAKRAALLPIKGHTGPANTGARNTDTGGDGDVHGTLPLTLLETVASFFVCRTQWLTTVNCVL
jgi:hypothetical protein